MAKHLFTSESVTAGHPDKVCDCISDAVLDSILEQDKNAHVACETTVTTGMVLIMGEISTTAKVDVAAIARKVINTVKTNITFALALHLYRITLSRYAPAFPRLAVRGKDIGMADTVHRCRSRCRRRKPLIDRHLAFKFASLA